MHWNSWPTLYHYPKINLTREGNNATWWKIAEFLWYFFVQIYDEVLEKLKKAYQQVYSRKGDSLDSNTLYGPLHSETAVANYKATIEQAKKLGGHIEFGGQVI